MDPTNWFVYRNFQKITVTAAQVVPAYPNPLVELTRGLSVVALQFDSVEYNPPPFDVTSRIGGIPAPGFFGFPLGP